MQNIITNIEELKKPAEPLTFLSETGIEDEEGNKIILQLKEVMEANSNLVALSAPQIGINKRIFCLRFNDQIKVFINPIITKKQGLKIIVETCSSLPNKEIVIGRPEEITVVYYNDKFKYEDNKLMGAAASIFDQQAQLLDGILPCDLGLVSDINEDGKIEDVDLPEIINFYKNTFLPKLVEKTNSLVKNNADAEKIFKQLKFTESVINGRITVVESEQETNKRIKAKKAANKAIKGLKLAEKQEQKANFNSYVKKICNKK